MFCTLVFEMRLCGFIDENPVICTYLFLTMWVHKYRCASTWSVHNKPKNFWINTCIVRVCDSRLTIPQEFA